MSMECRFCHKQLTKPTDYYVHLYRHINRDTVDTMTEEEIELSKIYYANRCEIKKQSYNKTKYENCNYECEVCESKFKYLNILKKHLGASHTKEELFDAGYDEEFIDDVNLFYKKRQEYQVVYSAEHKAGKRRRVDKSVFLPIVITAKLPYKFAEQMAKLEQTMVDTNEIEEVEDVEEVEESDDDYSVVEEYHLNGINN